MVSAQYFVPLLGSVSRILGAMLQIPVAVVFDDQKDGAAVVAVDSICSCAGNLKPSSKDLTAVDLAVEHVRRNLVVGSHDRVVVVQLGKLETHFLGAQNL